MDALLLGLLTFASVALRSFQTNVVCSQDYIKAFCVSSLMGTMSVVSLLFTVAQGWDALLPVILGGSLGTVSGMYLYNFTHREKRNDR